MATMSNLQRVSEGRPQRSQIAGGDCGEASWDAIDGRGVRR